MGRRLEPLGVGEIIDTGIALTRRSYGSFLALTALAVVPAQIATVLISVSALPDASRDPFADFGQVDADTFTALAANLVVLLLTTLAAAIAAGCCAAAAWRSYTGTPIDARESLRAVTNHLGPFLVAASVSSVAIALTSSFLLGFFLLVLWAVAMPVVVLERATGTGALGRSAALTSGRRWQVAGLLLVTRLLALVVQSALVVPIGLLLGFDGTVWAPAVAGAVAVVLVEPFVAVTLVVLYADLRVRQEGLDVQLLAQELPAPA